MISTVLKPYGDTHKIALVRRIGSEATKLSDNRQVFGGIPQRMECVNVGIRRAVVCVFIGAAESSGGGFTVCFCHPGGGFFGATSISDMLSSYSPPSMISISNREDGFQACKVQGFSG